MRSAVLTATLAMSMSAVAVAQPSARPRVTPFFSTVSDGPAFYVECRNATRTTLSSGARQWASSLRLDGTVVPEEDGRIGPGLTVDVDPDQTWRGIVVLRQSNTGYFPAPKFDAMVRMTRMVSVNEGRHTLAIKCADVWSDEIVFYWENERPPAAERE